MKVLVTGGGGFIGAWIAHELASDGITPVILDVADNRTKVCEIGGEKFARSLEWKNADIGDTDAVIAAAQGCNSIIHLAGLLTPACKANPVLGARVNLIGTLNVFLAARAHGMGSVLYMSSAGVFGPDGGDEPHPTTLYGAFKLASEHSARAFFEDEDISSVGFRPFVVYGPGRDAGLSAGPSLACQAAAKGIAYTIPFSGSYDMIHAQDVARIFVMAARARIKGAHVVNLIGHRATSADVVEAVLNAAPGAQIDFSGPSMPIESPLADASLQSLFPGWSPRSIQDGIASTIEFYRTRS